MSVPCPFLHKYIAFLNLRPARLRACDANENAPVLHRISQVLAPTRSWR